MKRLAATVALAIVIAAGCSANLEDSVDNPNITEFQVSGRDCIFVKVGYGGGLSCDWSY